MTDDTFDAGFDQARLNQLAEQHLANSQIEGKVYFFSESENNRIDSATWQFASKDYASLNDAGFKLHLMELLDILLIYRAKYKQANVSQGVVHVKCAKLSIEWLSKIAAEEKRYAR